MKTRLLTLGALITLSAFASAAPNEPRVTAAFEAGPAWQTRNDFRIPGDGGTLVEAPDPGAVAAWRTTLTWNLTDKQSLRFLTAPLRTETTFPATEPIAFQDLVYPAGLPVDNRFRFDSYRVSWYWRFAPRGKWSFRLGATVKVRSAEISLDGQPGYSVKDDLGVVPLVYAYARYQASDRFAIELEADALAAPQGRAEDVSLKGVVRLNDRVDFDLGYRLLEGGGDNDAVYTFAMVHYAVAGVRLRL
jgi:hypothetical protein